MKKHLFKLLLFTVLVIGLSGCRTSAPKLDYKKLARASVRLGVDIGMEDNHKLYLEAAEWIGTDGQKKESSKVARRNLREGDLVFFSSRKSRRKVAHVGIYLKDGKFVHASTSQGVIVSSLNEPYYRTHWISGGRVRK